MRRALYIVLVLVMAAACGPHRIPRDDMEDILYRMLVQDQQIKQNPQLRRQADTMLVYEGIFQAYGFNTDDFLYSLEYYLEEPARMEKDTTRPRPPVRPVDTLLVRMGKDTVQLVLPPDSLPEYPKDSLLFVRDTLRAPKDTLLAVKDSL